MTDRIDPETGKAEAPDAAGRPSRREFVALGVGALVIAATPGIARPKRRLIRRTVPLMGTLAEVGVVHRDPRHAQQAIAAAIAELRAVERAMTRFRPDSEIGRANLEAAERPVPLSPATAEVVRSGLVWAEASDGAFDPTLGRAAELWDVEHRTAPPPAERLRRFAGARLYRELELGEHGGQPVVVYRDPDIGLDLGGIGKGYGVDQAARALREWGVRDALVNVGGDLYALGVSEDGDAWEVGVRDPDDAARLVATFRISDRAVATSGDYARYFEHDGRRYHHLLDPATGAPRRVTTRSVTVVADDCMTADAAGTAVFGQPADEARRLIASVDRSAELLHIG